MAKELTEAHRKINGLFSGMRYGGLCNFSRITADDSADDALAKIAGNLERLSTTLVGVAERAAADDKTVQNHKRMFGALGDLLTAVQQANTTNT